MAFWNLFIEHDYNLIGSLDSDEEVTKAKRIAPDREVATAKAPPLDKDKPLPARTKEEDSKVSS